jgi:hypothetical protein
MADYKIDLVIGGSIPDLKTDFRFEAIIPGSAWNGDIFFK